jgi:hypothetical protein
MDNLETVVREEMFDDVFRARKKLLDLLDRIATIENVGHRRDLIKMAGNLCSRIDDFSRSQVECRHLGKVTGLYGMLKETVDKELDDIEGFLMVAILMD